METHVGYQRVIPRDLFNEAKLLKGWGCIALLVHNEMQPEGVTLEHDTSEHPGFDIAQDPDSADLYITNLILKLYDEKVVIQSSYNSKTPNTLFFIGEMMGHEGDVLTDDGKFTDCFLSYCTTMKTNKWLQTCGV